MNCIIIIVTPVLAGYTEKQFSNVTITPLPPCGSPLPLRAFHAAGCHSDAQRVPGQPSKSQTVTVFYSAAKATARGRPSTV